MTFFNLHSPDETVTSFFAVLAVIAVGPWLAERIKLPGLIGLLFGGFLVGPYALGIISENNTFVQSLGNIGLLYLMYLAGLDLDLEILRRYKRVAITFALMTFAFPLLFGYLGGVALGYETAAAILLGSIWASHTLLTYPILRRYGLANHPAVASTVGATVITDTLALIVLAGVSGYSTGDARGFELFVQITLGLVVLTAFCFLALPRIVRWLMPSLGQPATVRYIIAFAALLAAVLVSETFGIDGIVGAFFAGLALNPLIPKRGPLFEHIEFYGSALFIPLFLVSVGLIIEPAVMFEAATIGTAAVFALACIGGKLTAAILCKPVFGYSWDEVGAVFSLSVNQAAATLAATFVGYEIGLFGTTVVNAVLLVIVVSVVLGSLSAERYGRRLPAPPLDTTRLARAVMVVVDDATDSVVETEIASWLARADGGHVIPLVVHLAGHGEVDESRVEALNESLAGRGYDTKVVVRVDRSGADAVANAALGEKATIAIVPADRPGLEVAIFGSEEDRLARHIPVPMLLVLVDEVPRHVVLALSVKDLRARTHHLQVAFDVAERLVKAGHHITVFSPQPMPADRLEALGGCEVAFGADRAAFFRTRLTQHEHEAVLVPAPPGTSVFGDDIAELAGLAGTGLLIAVGSASADAPGIVTMGTNLAAGRERSA
jgi:Na+:H+ antiporter